MITKLHLMFGNDKRQHATDVPEESEGLEISRGEASGDASVGHT